MLPDNTSFIDGGALRRDLTAHARANGGDGAALKPGALAIFREAHEGARADIFAMLERRTASGLAIARALSACQDTIVQALYDFTVKHVYYAQNPTDAERLCFVAVGGYGRGSLAPGSDVDLLFIRPARRTAWAESVIEYMLYMLWDMGLKVGHATRSLDECIRLSREDMTIRTSILEARYLWGDEGLFDALRRRFWAEVAPGPGLDFVEAKLAERDARHTRAGESRYLVEPNVKDGKGGLRDLHTLFWIGKYVYRVADAFELVHHGVFDAEEYGAFQRAEDFLWEVRCHLHVQAGRAEERLSFDRQLEIARRMGYGEGRRAVERFMKEYFLIAKDVGDLTRILCAQLESQQRKRRPGIEALVSGLLRKRAGDTQFLVENGRLVTDDPEIFARDPVNLIRLFHVADRTGHLIHPQLLRLVTRSLDLIDDDLRADPEANRLFLQILCSTREPERILRRMNEAGVFGRFVPDFGRVVAMMQFNMYHHYTVDEHLIRAVGNIARVERGDFEEEHPLATRVIRRIESREALYVAMLLHDIAKGREEDHSVAGEEVARELCPRFGLSDSDTEMVAWLVRCHLLMSDVAQRRDIADPKTVQDFVDAVQSPERLRMLLCLTVADIRAVGPGVFNGWKGQLLRQLYEEASNLMEGGDASPRAARVAAAKARLEDALGDFTPQARARALERFYDGYWLALPSALHEAHARMMASADAADDRLSVTAESDTFRAITRVTIYTPDHPGLFSRLAGALAGAGVEIRDARIFTTTDGMALDVFWVQDADARPITDANRLKRLRELVAATLRGEVDPRRAIARRTVRRREEAFRVAPRVSFDNEASRTHTLIEVNGRDRPGLLHDLTRALFEAGVQIGSAVIATYGERAVDVFYVKDGYGMKITHPQRLARIRERLMEALGGAGVYDGPTGRMLKAARG